MKIRLLFVLSLGILLIIGAISYFYYSYQKKSLAYNGEPIFIADKITDKSVAINKNVNRFTLYTHNAPDTYSNINNVQSLGIKSLTGKSLKYFKNNNTQTLLSEETINQLTLRKKTADNYVGQTGSQHFFYQQNINGIPVYASSVNLHTSADDVYGLVGNVANSSDVSSATLTDEQAQQIALNQAKSEAESNLLYVYQAEKFIINLKILGLSDDDQNYLTLAVSIRSEENSSILFGKKYFVDLTSGKIIYSEPELINALNRQILNFSDGAIIRNEGQAAVSDSEANNIYDNFEKIYNFFSSNFQRDSFDGNGGTLYGIAHLQDRYGPNAAFVPDEKKFYFSNGMTTAEIIGHEYTHGVTDSRFTYTNQSGQLCESISDIFSHGVDAGNWSMGEGSTLGIMRYYDDPTKGPDKQPDRVFSPNYLCDEDNGEVHINNGILNKTFYLMVKGGSFNGCTIQGTTENKIHKIFYRAVTTYITPTVNYKEMYDAVNQACNDLYQSSSAECINVKSAMQATEMDQQTAGTQKSPKCNGAQPQTPACVSTQAPTATPATSGSPTSGPSPTSAATPTPRPTAPPLPTAPITPSGNVQLNLKLKLQGITKKPQDTINKLYVKVTLVSTDSASIKEESYGIFTSDNNATWSGSVFFNVKKSVNSTKFKILVKGPMQVQKKICDMKPTETSAGYYHCVTPDITITTGVNNLDFTKIVLLAGDLPVQDGIVNSYDLSLIRQRLGVTVTGPQIGDINMDGVIDTQDYSLIIYALSTRFDE